MGLAEAQANATALGRWLIVEVTASWASQQVSPSLAADHVAEFGLLARADLEVEATFLRQHDVASVPAVLVLLPGGGSMSLVVASRLSSFATGSLESGRAPRVYTGSTGTLRVDSRR